MKVHNIKACAGSKRAQHRALRSYLQLQIQVEAPTSLLLKFLTFKVTEVCFDYSHLISNQLLVNLTFSSEMLLILFQHFNNNNDISLLVSNTLPENFKADKKKT